MSFTSNDQTGQSRDSDVDPLTGATDTFYLASDETIRNLSAGIHVTNKTRAVQGRVWEDANANGIMEFGESALKGAIVNLADREGRDVLRSVFTDDQGYFEFDGLRSLPGRYAVTLWRDWQAGPRNTSGQHVDALVRNHVFTPERTHCCGPRCSTSQTSHMAAPLYH